MPFGCFIRFPVSGNSFEGGIGVQHRHLRSTLSAVAAGVLTGALAAGCGGGDAQEAAGVPQPVEVTPAEKKQLPRATTHEKLTNAPQDPRPAQRTEGKVLRIEKPQVVYKEPGGEPLAVLPAQQLSGPTWVPVVGNSPGWKRVMLPSRPNHSTGWLYAKKKSGITETTSSSVVKVDVSDRELTITDDGQQVGSWTVAVGKADTPTPTGRTFVLALLAPSEPTYSPLIVPLGSHSDTLTSYGGGPGTVGFHYWEDSSVFGRAVSHGCIRVPKPALDALSDVPLGSQVLIRE